MVNDVFSLREEVILIEYKMNNTFWSMTYIIKEISQALNYNNILIYLNNDFEDSWSACPTKHI